MAQRHSKRQPEREGGGDDSQAARPVRDKPASRWRELILGQAAALATSPIIGLIAGFLLLFGGIFLAIAWQVGPQPLIDSTRYKVFTAHATGRIVESWMAMEFDPADMGQTRRWFNFAKVAPCMVVEYSGDWGAPLRRAFCGNRINFRDDLTLDEWNTLMPGVPFVWQRDASGFAIKEIRLSKKALDWLAGHPPYDTFMLGKPPPATTLGALREQLDHPVDTAALSWAMPIPPFPLAYDPKHPDQPMPAKFVDDKQQGFWLGGLVLAALFFIPGLLVWRTGIGFVFGGQPGAVLWLLTIAPLFVLPWWSEALPQLLRHANANWASIGTDMLDDLSRTTRLLDSAPTDATLAGGERVVLRVNEGLYADTFGRMHFVLPDSTPKTHDLALAALRAQTSTQVRKLDFGLQAALFVRLRQDKDAGRDKAVTAFRTAAEDLLHDAETDPAARAAARNFLLFGMLYNQWDVDALEKPHPASSAQQ